MTEITDQNETAYDDSVEDETDAALTIATDLEPTKKIKLDGTDYELLTVNHLSPQQEAAVTATFSRFQRIFEQLEVAKNDPVAEKLAADLQQYRAKLIGLMTTIPSSVVRGLRPGVQSEIVKAIRKEWAPDGEDDE